MRARILPRRGAETLEAAIALPVLLVAAFCCLQISLLVYQCAAMSSAITEATAKADFASALTPGCDMDAEIERALAEASPGLLEGRIGVEGASGAPVDFSETESSSGAVSSERTVARISATVTYEVPTLLSAWGMGELRMSRPVEATVTVDERTEVAG